MHTFTNPLVEAANPLLNALAGIRQLPPNTDITRLRQQLVDAMRRFEVRGQRAQLPHETLVAARYCLCTVLDEAASLTQWGRDGVWPRSGLLVSFHNETWGGEKFFQMLARLSQDPQRNLHLLELLSYCLLLGFEGRYRVVDNGPSQLETLRQRLVQLIGSVRGAYAAPLSPKAFDPAAAPRPWRPLLPLWVFALGLLLLAGVGFTALHWRLGQARGPVLASIHQIALPALAAAPAPVAPVKIASAQTLRAHLQREIDQGYLGVREEDGLAHVTLRGDLLFGSGADTLRPAAKALMQRVAEALNQVPGDVVVRGYSDSDPITTRRFASNQQLSLARATTVSRLLQDVLRDTGRVRAEGHGEADPVAPNDSASNKALNRRVDILLLPTETLPRASLRRASDHA